MDADELDLLLADPRKFAPSLGDGISSDSILNAQKPKKDESHFLRARGKDRSILSLQRWGIVAPEGEEGEALIAAMRPLIELRTEEQGAEPIVFRVPPNMTRKAASDWLYQVYEAESIEEEDRPLYLCLLGSPDQATLDFQQTVTHSAYVGRVHFDKLDGSVDVDAYAEYAQKVVRYAREGFTQESPELLYYVARDGTRATSNAVPKLVSPSVDASIQHVKRGKLTANVREIDANSVSRLLSAQAAAPNGKLRPSVMLSVSHGLGGNANDYGSYDAQRRRQGSLVLGPNEILDAEAIAKETFLPGGLWLCFACFGAGTPARSEYFNWLSELAKLGAYRDSAKIVLQSLALSGNGFIAALPQAALRNPNGPLAVVAHLDLAWNFSYVDVDDPKKSRAAKFTRALHLMASGERIGVAHDEITEWFRETNHWLSSMYDATEDAKFQNRPDPIDPKKRGPVWLLRNDLRGYVLLGDPAVRLPQAEPAERATKPSETQSVPEIQSNTASAHVASAPDQAPPAISATAGDEPDMAPAPAAAAEAGDVPTPEEQPRDMAVRAMLEGNETPRAIAARIGCSVDELFAWFVAYWTTAKQSELGK